MITLKDLKGKALSNKDVRAEYETLSDEFELIVAQLSTDKKTEVEV
jgi:hypothetical protein